MAEYRIRCAEIWGGVATTDLDVITSALRASVYSKPCEGESGGDIYYFSVCGSDQLTRIAIADVQGHGEQVSQVSRWLYELIRDSMDTLDARGVLRDLNTCVIDHGFEAMSTVALLSYYLGDSNLYFSYAGHPPAFLYQHAEGAWRPLELELNARQSNLPLGILAGVEYDQSTLAIHRGDRLFMYTDGVVEYPDLNGQPLGERW